MTDYFDGYAVNRRMQTDQFQLEINKLPVDLLDFAMISELRHRVYGARIFPDEACAVGDGCLNDSARRELWRLLFAVQQTMLAQKRFLAAPAYIRETKLIDHKTKTFHARFPGIEKVNVVEVLTFQENVILSPFVIHDVELVNNGGVIEAHFDSTIAKNPHEVILRNYTTHEQYDWQLPMAGYPAKVGYDWVMPLDDSGTVAYNSNNNIETALQHYELMMGEILPINGVDIDDIVALHPGSQQILPFAKPPEVVLSGGEMKWRFWFYMWMMGKPEFGAEELDLVSGEFYKLYDTIELYSKSETTTQGLIHYRELNSDCSPEFPEYTYSSQATNFQIIDPLTSAVTYDMIDDDLSYRNHTRYRAEFYYKVNPLQDMFLFDSSIEDVRRAICAKVAAQINLNKCGCRPDMHEENGDFIFEMQKEYTKTKMDTIMGHVTVESSYGNKHGDMLYANMLKAIRLRPRAFVL